MTRKRGTISSLEEMKPIIQSQRDLLRRQDTQPRRGKLEGEWQSVQSPTDLRDRISVVIRELEARLDGTRSLNE